MGKKNRDTFHARGVASAAIARLVETARERDGLTIGDALTLTGGASFGFVMLMLALPAMIPIPGPFGLVFGSALAIVALQYAAGIGSVWLPPFFRNRQLSASIYVAIQRHADPVLRRIEAIVLPGRMKALTGRAMPYILGPPVFTLAVAIALPIPFGNIIPVVAICLLAIGLIERDGLMVLLGLLLTLVALSVTAALLQGAVSFLSMF
ncbi:exopolysaccharide biosynthesis protein [Pararhizobium antarcticum]|uniref:Exopolysaccharide biosynthesis protein n=1 Tax=Pararhizobium antarcticum TaxID=1798805 RepID=A0A657LK12_9HYPH|nr:exopolysaccharide biosynthesis protein [Pararhizobium antarcticum]OJF89759.1 hypothetical protein AX760_24695 [Pararhizobium antarcticum]OJF90807.1 hypothetical protein AX761_22905 [Rhizobium sp. 58]